jgi:hypothetical protein
MQTHTDTHRHTRLLAHTTLTPTCGNTQGHINRRTQTSQTQNHINTDTHLTIRPTLDLLNHPCPRCRLPSPPPPPLLRSPPAPLCRSPRACPSPSLPKASSKPTKSLRREREREKRARERVREREIPERQYSGVNVPHKFTTNGTFQKLCLRPTAGAPSLSARALTSHLNPPPSHPSPPPGRTVGTGCSGT